MIVYLYCLILKLTIVHLSISLTHHTFPFKGASYTPSQLHKNVPKFPYNPLYNTWGQLARVHNILHNTLHLHLHVWILWMHWNYNKVHKNVKINLAPPLSINAALIARVHQTFLSTHYRCGWTLLLLRPHSGFFLTSCTWESGLRLNKAMSLRLTWNILDTFSIWRARKQVMVGECCVKKFNCTLGALQRPFRELPFCPRVEMLFLCSWEVILFLYLWIMECQLTYSNGYECGTCLLQALVTHCKSAGIKKSFKQTKMVEFFTSTWQLHSLDTQNVHLRRKKSIWSTIGTFSLESL